jgi:hypothetical protein
LFGEAVLGYFRVDSRSALLPDEGESSHLELKGRLEVSCEKAISFRWFFIIFSLTSTTDEQNLPVKLLSTTNEYYLPIVTKPNKCLVRQTAKYWIPPDEGLTLTAIEVTCQSQGNV